MTSDERQLIEELETLNAITSTLNEAVDVSSALNQALARLVSVTGLETGWIFVRDTEAKGKWWGPGFRLVAHHNLPPAMLLDNPQAWKKGCDCQTMCRKERLDEAYNEVRCSRLASVEGDKAGLRVHASTPLRSGEEVLGILNVAAPDWESFRERDLALLTSVGGHIGVALERARLYELLQEQRIHEQAALLDFSNQLLARHNLEDLMDYLVLEVRRLLQVDACALLLPDERDPDHLRFTAATGWNTDPVAVGRRVPADDRSGSGRVMRTQEPIVVENIEEREQAPWSGGWVPDEGFKSAAIVPLIADGRSIGALVVDTRRRRRLDEEAVRFLQVMANQAALALEKARLHQEEIQRNRLQEELSVARQIQLSMLPPSCPVFKGWQFAAHYQTARQVGGDFYDFFSVPVAGGDQERLAVIVADVADKGVPAALFMALSRTTIRNVAISDRTPAAALAQANEFILSDSQTDLFLSAFYALFTAGSGRLTYCNAGHNPPLWYQSERDAFQPLSGDGIVLGVLEDVSLQDTAVEVAPGDLIIFYTDGVTEAMNDEMEEFGVRRLQGAIAGSADGDAANVLEAIVAAVDAYTGEMARWDDITLVVAQRLSS